MPYRLDSGTRGALLLSCFILFLALLLVVRRKWRLAEVRRVEVVRLMRLAVAEAEMAEREAIAFVTAAEPPATPGAGGGTGSSICAVCMTPTTNRCARCKIVKYCSGKCQIIHWRQGHKDECHLAPVDHYKSQPHVPDLKGEQAERSETTNNGSDTKFHSNIGHYSAYQRVSHVEAEQVTENSIDSKGSVNGGDCVEPPETSCNESAPSKSDHPTKAYNEFGNIKHKRSATATEGGFSGQRFNDSSPRKDHTEIKTGQLFSTNFSNFEKPFFNGSFKSSRDFIVDSEQPMHVKEKSESKPNPFSSIKFSDRYLDAGLVQTNIESMPVSSNFKFSNQSENSRSFKCDNEYKESTIRIKSDDCSETHTSCIGDHCPLDTKILSIKSVELSTSKPVWPASISVTLEPTDRKKVGFEQTCGEKSKEQMKSLSPSFGEHSAPLVEGLTSPRKASLSVRNGPPFTTKSFKISGSLLNGKTVLVGDAKQKLSSSSLGHTQPGVCSYGSENCDYKILFPYELFTKLYNSDKVGLNPCGLINCGNSCYANTVLQCLAFTRPLAAYLLEGFHAKTCPKKEWCFTCAFGSLLMKANQGKSPLSPIEIISHVHNIGSNFSQGTEEDAHEFLRHAIDAMQSACLKEAGENAVSQLAQETTLIQLVFGGYLHSKIKCMRCKSKSERREKMMDLAIEMHGDIKTLEEALARFTATEVLEGMNKYKCDRCKSYEPAKKHLTILEAPNVLTIALKRYQSGEFGKLNKVVRFPEYLNLAPYMRGSDDNSPVYRLYAVVVHKDVMNATFSGHYICFVKSTLGKWFKADDSVVKQVDFQTVLSQGAYMLFYARCSPRAPSLLRKEIAKKSRLKQAGDSHKGRPSSSFSLRGFPESHRSNDSTSRLHIFEERARHSKPDNSSDSSSLFSYSDENSSWSAESTKDSATSDDFTESLYGRVSRSSPLRFSEDSGPTHSPKSDGRMSESPDLNPLGSRLDEDGFPGGGSLPFLYSTKQCRTLTADSSSRNETNWVRSSEVKASELLRRPSKDRTAQTFY